MKEHPLIADLIANAPNNDRKPHTRIISHKCGHKARVTIYGDYLLEDRFQFASENNCKVCMMYESARTCFGYSRKNFGRKRNTGFATLAAMINAMEADDIYA
jgi:hypothetical protein